MKKLICEMCGSDDLVKQNGLFVCQMCGCKYTVEEAKKIMIEGTVDVSGSSVKIDTSEKTKNLFILARRAKASRNYNDATKYYTEICTEDPNNWEAVFYSTFYTALICNNIDQAGLELKKVIPSLCSSCQLIKEYVPESEKVAAYTEIIRDTAMLVLAFFETTKKTYMGDEFADRAIIAITTMIGAGVVAEKEANDILLAKEIYEKCLNMCNSTLITKKFAAVPQESLEKLAPQIAELRQKKKAEYWALHAEEKKRLEDERDGLVNEQKLISNNISEIERLISSSVLKENYNNLQRKIEDYKHQLNSLGLFKSKEKKNYRQ